MKIVIIAPFLKTYSRGIERFAVDLASELVKLKYDVHVLTWKNTAGIPIKDVRFTTHEISLVRYFQSYYAGLRYYFLLRKISPDIVYITFLQYGEELALKLYKASNLRIFFGLHYPEEASPFSFNLMKKSRLMNRVNEFLAVSDYVLQDVDKSLQKKAKMVPNGVNVDFFKPLSSSKKRARASLNMSENSLVFLTTAALVDRKKIDVVFHLVAAMISKFPHLIYVVAGEGMSRDKLVKLSKELGIEKNVHFAGVVEDVRPYYYAADIFILLSFAEAFGISILEAMAAELPVVLPSRSPFLELFNSNGVLFVDDTDNEAMLSALDSLLNDRDSWREMGKANLHFVAKRYDWNVICKEYDSIFKESHKILEVPILTYHQVGKENSSKSPGLYLNVKHFKNQMKVLSFLGYQCIPLKELVNALNGSSHLPLKGKKYFVITFDDGYEGVYHNAFPILRKYGFTATVFLVARTLGDQITSGSYEYLKKEELEEMIRHGFDVESHTSSHRSLVNLSEDALGYELNSSKELIEDVLGVSVTGLAYPSGHFNDRVAKFAQDAGYKYGCTAVFGLSNNGRQLFNIKRIGIGYNTSIFHFLYRLLIYSKLESKHAIRE